MHTGSRIKRPHKHKNPSVRRGCDITREPNIAINNHPPTPMNAVRGVVDIVFPA
jgi:hypothetical protein